jgi:hypothetical protein
LAALSLPFEAEGCNMEINFLTKILQFDRFCLGKHQPVPRQVAAKGSLLEGKCRFEAGERTNPLRLIIELCALRSR